MSLGGTEASGVPTPPTGISLPSQDRKEEDKLKRPRVLRKDDEAKPGIQSL